MSEYLTYEYWFLVVVMLLLLSVYYNYKLKKMLKEREEGDAVLIKNAYYNKLTQLPNKANLEILIAEQIQRSHRHEKPFLICVVKVLNYSENTILEMSNRIINCIREEDLVGHIEDDTFVIIFNEYLEEANYALLLKRMKRAFAKENIFKFSIGKSNYPDDATSMSGLIYEASRQSS